MKKCAKCDAEYDDAYDGCPECAKPKDAFASVKPWQRWTFAGGLALLAFGELLSGSVMLAGLFAIVALAIVVSMVKK